MAPEPMRPSARAAPLAHRGITVLEQRRELGHSDPPRRGSAEERIQRGMAQGFILVRSRPGE